MSGVELRQAAADFDHVGISVSDLDRMQAFYEAGLEMVEEFRFTVEEANLEAVILRAPNGLGIELLRRSGSDPGRKPADHHDAVMTQGYGHFCLRVKEIDSLHRRLIESGGSEISPPGPAPGDDILFAYLADPEGNLVELVQFPTDD